MKEMIIIEKELLEKKIKVLPIQRFNVILLGKEYKTEKYPTNWEELKELCENLEQKVNNLIVKFLPPEKHYDCEVIWFKQYGLWVYSNGFILFKKDIEEDMIGGAKNRTPEQMWQIIKNLIG